MVGAAPLVADLDEARKAVLADLVTCRNLADGEIVLREGDASNEVHVIAAGSLAVTRDTGGGEWVVIDLLRRHDIAGELGFLDDTEHSATLRAVGPTRVFSLRRDKLEQLPGTQPVIVYHVMGAIVREAHGILRHMNAQYVELTNDITKQHGR